MSESEAFEEYARKAVARDLPLIERSQVFLALFNGEYEKEAVTVLQLGLAILLDKPIYLLVPKGVKVPEHLRRAADGIEEYVADDLDAAARRLLQKAAEKPRG